MVATKRKIQDENREFISEWTNSYAFISNTKGLPLCLICKQVLSNNKSSNVRRHFQNKHTNFANMYPSGEARTKAVEELKCVALKTQNIFTKWLKSSDSTTAASFVISHEITKRGKPFSDGEYIKECFINAAEHLFSDFGNKGEIVEKIQKLPLSAKTVRERTIKMEKDITSQQINDINSSPGFSIACDESCDITDEAQVVLFCRYISTEGPREELIDMISLTSQTRGEDILKGIISSLETKEINLNNIISVATDGAPSMIGKYKGFVSLLREKLNHKIMTFHCIIHQEALCSQSLPPEFNEVMALVMKMVNKIITKGLNHRQFREFLNETESQYSDLLIHNEVRWLSRGRVLERFASCLEEVKSFFQAKRVIYPQLTTSEWLIKFYFMVDITSHLNTLNLKLQGKGNTAINLLEEVLSFERKLTVFSRDIEKNEFAHFPSLKKYKEFSGSKLDVGTLMEAILKLEISFKARFQEFRNEKMTLLFIIKPLEADISCLNFEAFPNVNKAEVEIEMADIKEREIWASKFKTLISDLESLERKKATLQNADKNTDIQKPDRMIFDVWNSLPDVYANSKNYAFGILTVFGSTYICEQVFSSINFIKGKLRNRLNAASLLSCIKLKTTSYSPNIEKLSNEIQQQPSH